MCYSILSSVLSILQLVLVFGSRVILALLILVGLASVVILVIIGPLFLKVLVVTLVVEI